MAPVWVVLTGAVLSGAVPSWREPIAAAARRFMDARGYQATTLDGVPQRSPAATSERPPGHRAVVSTTIIMALALAIATIALFGHRFPPAWRQVARRFQLRLLVPIRTLHSGKVGDYVAWLTLGVSAFGIALLALTGIRWFQ
jgi:multicomponent Na+:H+ antiporter subunit D